MTTKSYKNNPPDKAAPKDYKKLPRQDKKEMKLEDAAGHSLGKEGLEVRKKIEKEAENDAQQQDRRPKK